MASISFSDSPDSITTVSGGDDAVRSWLRRRGKPLPDNAEGDVHLVQNVGQNSAAVTHQSSKDLQKDEPTQSSVLMPGFSYYIPRSTEMIGARQEPEPLPNLAWNWSKQELKASEATVIEQRRSPSGVLPLPTPIWNWAKPGEDKESSPDRPIEKSGSQVLPIPPTIWKW